MAGRKTLLDPLTTTLTPSLGAPTPTPTPMPAASPPPSASPFTPPSSSTTTTTTTITTTIATTTAVTSTTTPPALRALEDTYIMDNFQNDHTKEGSQSLPSRPRPQNPQVIVSAGVPVYQEPRPSYGYHGTRGVASGGTFHKVPSPPAVSVGAVTVRVEEICLVLVVLMLWAGAITLFINRWGKLRMLEPYQPAYTAPVVPPRPPPPPVGPCINIQSTSDLTLTEGGAAGGRYDWGAPENYGRGSLASGYLGMDRSPSCLSVRTLNPQRKVKSAVDLVSLVMQEKMSSSVHLAATNV
ncbi:uncharacterized protein [Panulirus ornatus]